MRLAIFDFDGTLFASPGRPSWWPFQGFWGRPESLEPPHVPDRPGADWWSSKVVTEAKRAITDSETYTILLTGRPQKLSGRIKGLLGHAGLRFDEYHFSNDDTLSFKLRVMGELVNKLQPEQVTLWDDRSEHIAPFEAHLEKLGVEFKVHKVPRAMREFENPPTTAFRVAARWQRRLADVIGDPEPLIKNFEKVIDDLAVLEKDIPWMLEAEKLYYAEGKLWNLDKWHSKEPEVEQVKNYLSYRHDFVLKVKFSSHGFQRAQALYLFLGLLQQYDLPPKTRKTIEAAAKYHASARKAPPKEKALEAYMKMMATVRGQLAAAKDALIHGKPRGAVEETEQAELRAGSLRIVNTGGFDDKTMAEVKQVVERSAHLLQSKGLDRVVYGDVLVSRTLSRQNVLAFYLTTKDELFVRANLRGKQNDAVRTVCHELGHRLHFKFLKDKDTEIRSIYAQIARKASGQKIERVREVLKDHPVLPGDKYVESGKVWEVTGTDWSRGGIVVQLVRKLDDPETKQTVALKAHIPLEGYLVNKGLLTNLDLSGFVTRYASKNHEENFAEMIAAYCINRLPDDQIAMLEGVIA